MQFSLFQLEMSFRTVIMMKWLILHEHVHAVVCVIDKDHRQQRLAHQSGRSCKWMLCGLWIWYVFFKLQCLWRFWWLRDVCHCFQIMDNLPVVLKTHVCYRLWLTYFVLGLS